MTTIRTARLELRLQRDDDADTLLAYYGDPTTVRLTPHDQWDAQAARRHVRTRISRTGIAGPGDALALVAEHEGRVVGDVALGTRASTVVGEVAWAMDPRASGRGFATEAVAALLDHAFHDVGMHRVSGQVHPRKAASVRVCEKTGMSREGHLRPDYFCKGEWCDTLVFARLRDDPPYADPGRRADG